MATPNSYKAVTGRIPGLNQNKPGTPSVVPAPSSGVGGISIPGQGSYAFGGGAPADKVSGGSSPNSPGRRGGGGGSSSGGSSSSSSGSSGSSTLPGTEQTQQNNFDFDLKTESGQAISPSNPQSRIQTDIQETRRPLTVEGYKENTIQKGNILILSADEYSKVKGTQYESFSLVPQSRNLFEAVDEGQIVSELSTGVSLSSSKVPTLSNAFGGSGLISITEEKRAARAKNDIVGFSSAIMSRNAEIENISASFKKDPLAFEGMSGFSINSTPKGNEYSLSDDFFNSLESSKRVNSFFDEEGYFKSENKDFTLPDIGRRKRAASYTKGFEIGLLKSVIALPEGLLEYGLSATTRTGKNYEDISEGINIDFGKIPIIGEPIGLIKSSSRGWTENVGSGVGIAAAFAPQAKNIIGSIGKIKGFGIMNGDLARGLSPIQARNVYGQEFVMGRVNALEKQESLTLGIEKIKGPKGSEFIVTSGKEVPGAYQLTTSTIRTFPQANGKVSLNVVGGKTETFIVNPFEKGDFLIRELGIKGQKYNSLVEFSGGGKAGKLKFNADLFLTKKGFIDLRGFEGFGGRGYIKLKDSGNVVEFPFTGAAKPGKGFNDIISFEPSKLRLYGNKVYEITGSGSNLGAKLTRQINLFGGKKPVLFYDTGKLFARPSGFGRILTRSDDVLGSGSKGYDFIGKKGLGLARPKLSLDRPSTIISNALQKQTGRIGSQKILNTVPLSPKYGTSIYYGGVYGLLSGQSNGPLNFGNSISDFGRGFWSQIGQKAPTRGGSALTGNAISEGRITTSQPNIFNPKLNDFSRVRNIQVIMPKASLINPLGSKIKTNLDITQRSNNRFGFSQIQPSKMEFQFKQRLDLKRPLDNAPFNQVIDTGFYRNTSKIPLLLPPISLGMDDFGKGNRRGKRKVGRNPSLVAAAFDLKAFKPDFGETTGLIARPFITRRKKRKR